MFLTAASVIGHDHAFFVEVVNAFGIGNLRVIGPTEDAQAGRCVGDEIDYLDPLWRDRKRRHRHINLVGGEHWHLGLMRHGHRLKLDAEQSSVLLSERPTWTGPLLPASTGIFNQPRWVCEHTNTKGAGFLDRLDARAVRRN